MNNSLMEAVRQMLQGIELFVPIIIILFYSHVYNVTKKSAYLDRFAFRHTYSHAGVNSVSEDEYCGTAYFAFPYRPLGSSPALWFNTPTLNTQQ